MTEHTNLLPICIPQFARGHAKRFNNTAAWVVGWAGIGEGWMNDTKKMQFYVNTRYVQTHVDKRNRFYVETDGPGENFGVCGFTNIYDGGIFICLGIFESSTKKNIEKQKNCRKRNIK
jgi:hypothetical protein